jgi:hypothetical protein
MVATSSHALDEISCLRDEIRRLEAENVGLVAACRDLKAEGIALEQSRRDHAETIRRLRSLGDRMCELFRMAARTIYPAGDLPDAWEQTMTAWALESPKYAGDDSEKPVSFAKVVEMFDVFFAFLYEERLILRGAPLDHLADKHFSDAKERIISALKAVAI